MALRSTCLGDIEVSSTLEMEAVSKANEAIEITIQKRLEQEESVDTVKGRQIANSVGKVAVDLVV